jgi:hypothetical protein
MSMPGPQLSDGAVFDPGTGSWRAIPAGGVPGRVEAAAAAWDGTLFVWGGGVLEPTDTGNHTVPQADGATFALGDATVPGPVTTLAWPSTTVYRGPPPGMATGAPVTTPPATAATATAAAGTTRGPG